MHSTTTDGLLAALAHGRRRTVLRRVLEEGPTTLEALAATIHQRDVRVCTDGGRSGIAVDLHHRHLPRLDDAGLVEYHDDGTVAPAEGIDEWVLEVLALLPDAE